MARFTVEDGRIEIDFQGIIPGADVRADMKNVGFTWNKTKMVWSGPANGESLAVAMSICNEGKNEQEKRPARREPSRRYALKVRIQDMISADKDQFEIWEKKLKDHVNEIMGEDNVSHSEDSVSRSQESVWMNCFRFIARNLSGLSKEKQEFELVFEYSLPGTVHERPDVLILTQKKVLSLEFKRKSAPQLDDNKDDVAQAIRYGEWIRNHHRVTRERGLEVKSFLVCTGNDAVDGPFRGIDILSRINFCAVLEKELDGEQQCDFIDEWLDSVRTEMPDMLQAIEIMYREGRIPYISDVNEKCLKKVLKYIDDAKKDRKKLLIIINGVPGAGKTAVGQSVVYEENMGGKAKAVYLSGNGPLVEVLQYQINQVGNNEHMGENAIQGMYGFKTTYFSRNNVPEQSILIFDEAQHAWDAEKMKRGYSEPEGLFDVGERIFRERGYAVLIGLYGNGQVIYTGEETGLPLWKDSLENHADWNVVASDSIANGLQGLGERLIVDSDVFLSASLRADFIDCSGWVEQAIGRTGDLSKAKKELAELQKTSLRICVTRDIEKVKSRAKEMDEDHPEWKYGILISNFADNNVIRAALHNWNIGYNGANVVANRGYGPWFSGRCRKLNQACTVYGSQGLELDCPIVVFGGEYIRKDGRWVTNGNSYERRRNSFQDPETIVENNFRVLLTRARKELIIVIPNVQDLNETYNYFTEMGMDEL